MLILPIDQIKISPNRQRREFDPEALQQLADSIDKNGLLQALVVRPDEEGGWFLVCGERRLRAVRDYLLPIGGSLRYGGEVLVDGFMPANPIYELSELAAEEAELEENIRRVDLSWQERAAATARLSSLRSKQALSVQGTAPTVAEISLEVRGSSEGIHHEETRREILISKHLGNPVVATAKSLGDAWKALKREESLQRNAELAVTVGRTFTADLHTAHNEDSLLWMVNAPANQFDVILTDPPYGMGADEFGDSGGKVPVEGHGYKDDADNFERIFSIFVWQSFRLAKSQAHLYVFCDIDHFTRLRGMFTVAGWDVFRTPLIWHKPNGNRAPWPSNGPHRKYEIILYAMKGKKNVTKLFPDLVSYNSDDNLGHSAQKPISLFLDLLKRSVKPGDKVFDPFAGTGTIFPAAHELKCTAVGIEQDTASYGIALERLKRLKADEN